MKVLFFIIAIFTSTIAQAVKPMQPFGGILWTDDFIEVAEKVKKMGVESLAIKISRDTMPIKGDINKKNISNLIGKVLEKHSPKHFKKEWKNRVAYTLGKYKDQNGNTKLVVNKNYSIIASPIIISGVPFEIEIVFSPAYGLVVDKKDSILVEPKMGYTFPLIISDIILSSESAVLATKYKDINKIIQKKYSGYDLGRFGWRRSGAGGGTIVDHKGGELFVSSSDRSYKISYK